MLRLLLVVEPGPEQRERVAEALAVLTPSGLYVASGSTPLALETADRVATRLGLTAIAEARLDREATAVSFVELLATEASQPDGTEPVVVALAGHEVVGALVTHALAAPVASGRIRFDAGAIAEVEVRADAPWTVNRLNDGCHLDDSHI